MGKRFHNTSMFGGPQIWPQKVSENKEGEKVFLFQEQYVREGSWAGPKFGSRALLGPIFSRIFRVVRGASPAKLRHFMSKKKVLLNMTTAYTLRAFDFGIGEETNLCRVVLFQSIHDTRL